MKPEENAEVILWDWLKTESKYIKEIYFNRKNKLNAPIFHTKGLNKKPDLLINYINPHTQKSEYIIIEVKDGTISKNVHDGHKILSIYYKRFIENKTMYYIHKEKVKVNHFAIATQFSKFGRLFDIEKDVIDNYDSDNNNNSWRKLSFQSKLIPRYEYRRTCDSLRNLWSNFNIIRKDYKLKNKKSPSVGFLISDIGINYSKEVMELEQEKTGNPLLVSMIYKDWKGKPQWRQGMIKL